MEGLNPPRATIQKTRTMVYALASDVGAVKSITTTQANTLDLGFSYRRLGEYG